jgi:carboxypeptidase PM20D1
MATEGSKRRRLWIAGGLIAAVLLLAAGLLVHALDEPAPPRSLDPLSGLAVEPRRAAQALSAYVRIDTSTPPGIPRHPRPAYIDHLLEEYVRPLGLDWEIIEDRSLLIRWRAPDASSREGPVLLLSHADVVPVPANERPRWSHPPFGGVIEDGYVWGRGALDNKASTICQLEAIRALKEAGLAPRRDIFLLVVPDEEIGGEQGAGLIVREHLDKLEGPYAVFDEGSFIIPDFVPGALIAPVAVSEKRYVTIRLSVEGPGGHSSMPPRNSPTRTLSAALGKLSDFQHPPRIEEPVARLLDRMAEQMPLGRRVVLKNRWLFQPLVEDFLASKPASNAMIRDTIALTVLDAGSKENVIPSRAEAVFNMRLLPSSDLERVLRRVRARIDDDRIDIEVTQDEGASPVSPMDGKKWDRLRSVLTTAVEGVTVAPMISPGTMDARWFAQQGFPTYRLLPYTLDKEERSRMHGIDERISIENLEQASRVYAHLMRYY